MNLKEAGAVMDVLTVAYPQFYRNQTDAERVLAARLWGEMFREDDVGVVLAAVKAHIAGDVKGYPPHIGAIKNAIVKLTAPPELEMSELEAWHIVRKAIHGAYMEEWSRKARYGDKTGAEYYFDQLPPLLQRIVGGPEQLAAWNRLDANEIDTVLQSNFMRSFRARAKSEKEYMALPSDIRQTMERLSAGTVKALEGGGDV